MEVNARIRRVHVRNTNIDTEQQSTTTTAWERCSLAVLDITERPLCSWKVLCTEMESNGGKAMSKFDDFVVNLGGLRPPRRVRAYLSRNNNELDNTLTEQHQSMYLVEFYV